MLCKLSVPGRPTNLDYSRARACCACSGCGWGMFGHFISRLSFFILSQRAVKPKTTNQHQAGGETMTDVSREIYL